MIIKREAFVHKKKTKTKNVAMMKKERNNDAKKK